ncbi:hypothetical protein ASPWEDRAFT_235099 [Aspergillus wentii DTO 134E9]|uniref:Caspase family p20 domain-containing protein n=1 Tax=Aspergillus wentii DTO 134E9 TaxID=1073089 RepID=A0A1L9S0W6_ASPWE|nr:uncharacterized protein ASPWEDRAFT_235099 [Aspergillus wentii DTO 134E9]OJJ40815.1 hypothetical protein ASPWEDRAFT_235099 [Aspergillus wentii DTO 134E9]
MPGLAIRDKLDNMLTTAVSSSGRTLVLVHYAGHGEDIEGELHFVGPPGHSRRERTIRANRWIFAEVDMDDSFLGPADLVDAIFFFDSCYSHLTTRSPVRSRVVEVLAAVDASDPFAFPPRTRPSFTAEVANEIAFRKARGDRVVEFAELVQFLRASSEVKPIYAMRVGFNSTRLTFPDILTQSTPQFPSLQAVFSFHVYNASSDDIAEYVVWTQTLPPDIGLSSENTYATNCDGVCLILRSSYAFYTKLAGLPGVQLVCETR